MGITVKDSNGKKLKPTIELFVKRAPFLNLEKYLILDKSGSVSRTEVIYNTYASPCNSDNPILISLLDNLKLKFVDSKNKIYYLYKNKTDTYLSTNFDNNLLMDHIYGITENILLEQFFDSYEYSFNKLMKEIFLSKEITVNISQNFKLIMKEMGKNKIYGEFLKNLLEILPIYDDHRKNYYNQLIKLYNSIYLRKHGGFDNESNYLECTIESPIDQKPILSLKRELNK
ncbi:hypothetical protein TCON_0908 [Astathelohania contejeani]|uniref:Uncharacterized protein n=1 Tax=Astathelohania contejeani TaxID=164912 RepID=A0ABQ7I0E1_9MICR|nr:hypothetical protein TCON_0908 [Thelohania contejeani]